MSVNRIFSISALRVFCLIQVFLILYFAGIGLRNYTWIFNVAVPAFLLVSAFLYGLKRTDETVFGWDFLLKRFKAIAVIYYPFIISVFVYYAITDSANLSKYFISLIGEMLFLTNYVDPLPYCGHLWFMQVLVMCYVALFVASRSRFISRFFKSYSLSVLLFVFVVLAGFIYRGASLVYLFFYLLVYFNAQKIANYSTKYSILYLVLILLSGYFLMTYKYIELFKIGIYLNYILTCIMAIITIKIFTQTFSQTKNRYIVSWLSGISMEFYLIHHLYVYDNPLYISLFATISLSILLHFISKKTLLILT